MSVGGKVQTNWMSESEKMKGKEIYGKSDCMFKSERRRGLWQVSYYEKYGSFVAVFQTNEPHFTFHNQPYTLQGFEPVKKIFILLPGRQLFVSWAVVGFHQCLTFHSFIGAGIDLSC